MVKFLKVDRLPHEAAKGACKGAATENGTSGTESLCAGAHGSAEKPRARREQRERAVTSDDDGAFFVRCVAFDTGLGRLPSRTNSTHPTRADAS